MLRVSEAGCSLANHNLAERVVPFPDYAAAAVCLSWEQLFDALPSVTSNVVLKKNVEGAARSWTVPPDAGKRLVAAVYEFDLTGPPGTTVWFRTVCTATGASGAWDDDPPAPHPNHPHVRGWWPKSALEVPMAGEDPFDAALSGGSDDLQSAVCEQLDAIEHSTGLLPETGGFGAISGAGHEFDLVNKGCYGVNLEYTKQLVNNGSETGHVHVGLVARNVDTYFGAAHVSSPDPVAADKRYVPPLAYVPPDPPEEPDARREMVDLLQSRTGMKIPVAPGPGMLLRVRIANGGACATPVNIVLSREVLDREEVEEPE
ncbi:MAG: hypothetical protein AB7F50_08685 [Fimbriimonadaceae bacterium]